MNSRTRPTADLSASPDAPHICQRGERWYAKFISLDRKSRSLSLSIRALEDEELAESLEETIRKMLPVAPPHWVKQLDQDS